MVTKSKRRKYQKLYYKTDKGRMVNILGIWKSRGLKETMAFKKQIYEEYCNSTECELCGEQYSINNRKEMEHCHVTGKFRNIVCRRCNAWKTDKRVNNIYRESATGLYKIRIIREGRYIVQTTRRTKESAEIVLQQTRIKYPWYFT